MKIELIALIVTSVVFAASVPAQEPPTEQPPSTQPVSTDQPPTSQPGSTDQPPATQPTAPPTSADLETSTELTAEEVQQRITQIEGANDLDETQRTEILGLYRQALDNLNAAKSWLTSSAEYRKGREEAPTILEQVKADLDAAKSGERKAEVPEGKSLQEVTVLLDEANRVLSEAQTLSKKLEDEAANRESRRLLIPGLIAEANKRLEKVAKATPDPNGADLSPQLLAAKRALLRTQKKSLESEIQAYEEELQFYTARRELLTARRELAKLALADAKARVTALDATVNRLRQEEVKEQQKQAEEELSRTIGPLREIAETNQKLADERANVVGVINYLNRKTKRLQRISEKLESDFRFLREHIQNEWMADVVGSNLRDMRTELQGLSSERLDLYERGRELTKAQFRLTEIEDQRIELADIESGVTAALARISTGDAQVDRQQIEERARELLVARRDLLDALKKDYDAYLDRLVRVTTDQNSLLTKVAEMQKFVGRHVLWSRSTTALTQMDFPTDWYLVEPPMFFALLQHLFDDFATHLLLYCFCALVIVLYLVTRRSMGPRLVDWGQHAIRPSCDTFQPTIKALGATLAMAGIWPAVLAFIGWRLSSGVSARSIIDLAPALGAGLLSASYLWFLLSFVRRLAAPNRLAESLLAWHNVDLPKVRRGMFVLLVSGLPAAFIVAATESYPVVEWKDSFGRLALIIGMVLLSFVAWRLLDARHGAFTSMLRKNKKGWIYNLRPVWFPVLIVLPLVIAIASAAGYHYTAIELLRRLSYTMGLLLAVAVLHASLLRWLLVAQRRLAIRRAKRLKEKKEKEAKEGAADTTTQELQVELVTVGGQTRSLLRAAVVVIIAVGVWSAWAEMLPALSVLEQVRLWTYTVTEPAAAEGAAPVVQYITLDNLLIALVVMVAGIFLAKNIPGLLEITILQKLPFDRGGKFAIASLARYVIGVVGILMAFTFLGVSWSSVQWLVAAMTVGLGFGLQEIFANFVSGLILLFERPIRVGDTVTVGGVTGDVTQIKIRATTIVDWDNKELVIPNREFVTGQVINWSLTDSVLRVVIQVGIAYGSDVELAETILHQVAKEDKHVLDEPKPRVLFMAFGESSLNFELRVYVPSVDYFLKVKHVINKAIDREFRKAGIEIAFPQRDLHIRSIRDALPILNDGFNRLPAPQSKRQEMEADAMPDAATEAIHPGQEDGA